MPRDTLSTPTGLPDSLPLSPGVRAGGLLFLSGQVGFDPATGKIVPGGAGAETEKIFDAAETLLAAAGKSLDDVAKANVFLASMEDYAAMNAVYARRFARPYPARTAVAVAALPLGARVEIEFVAG